MTVTVAVNAVDSIVLASDSATTQGLMVQNNQIVPSNIWNSANKIVNLRKAWPIGAMTWGCASIGGRSIATLAKELRCRFSGERPDYTDWTLDKSSYTIPEVADRVKTFFYDEQYKTDPKATDALGLAVAGYSANSDEAELHTFNMSQASCDGPKEPKPRGEPALLWMGQVEAVSRLVNGVSPGLGAALLQLGVPASDVDDYVQKIQAKTALPLVFAGMPVGEVIDLADFLVETSIKFVRFTPGNQIVGGPIEIAAMTKHEGFKWIKRKHHYPQALNVAGTWP